MGGKCCKEKGPIDPTNNNLDTNTMSSQDDLDEGENIPGSADGKKKDRKLKHRKKSNSELTDKFKSMSVIGKGNTKHETDPGKSPRKVFYYGWLYSETVSLSLRRFADDYLQKCISGFPSLKTFLTSICSGKDVFAHYLKPVGRDGLRSSNYHTTAKFCGQSLDKVYADKASSHLGQDFDMSIVGLFITKSTFGFRIALDPSQKELFDEERLPEHNAAESTPPEHKNTSLGKPTENPAFPGLHFVNQSSNFHRTSTRAHITLGCSPGVKAQRTGKDLLDIIKLETQVLSAEPTSLSESTTYSLDGGTVRHFVDKTFGTVFVMYPSHKIIAKANFNEFY